MGSRRRRRSCQRTMCAGHSVPLLPSPPKIFSTKSRLHYVRRSGSFQSSTAAATYVPFRLARLQKIDFRTDYAGGLQTLVKALGTGPDLRPKAAALRPLASSVQPMPQEGIGDRAAHTPSKLQKMTAAQLASIAKIFEIPGYGSLRGDDLIFKILQAQSEKLWKIFAEGVWRSSRTAPAFCALLIPTIFLAQTTCTSLHLRSSSSGCGPAIPSPARSGLPAKGKRSSI